MSWCRKASRTSAATHASARSLPRTKTQTCAATNSRRSSRWAAPLIVGPKDEGESCSAASDCDRSSGFECVMKADSAQGRCEIPEPVGAGRDCEAAQKTCPADFYCDGNHCVEGKDEGDPCTIHDECGETAFCNAAGECEARRSVDSACGADFECSTGICYEFEGDEICTDRIILARSEPLCEELR